MKITFTHHLLRTLLLLCVLLNFTGVWAGEGTWGRRIDMTDVLLGNTYTITEPTLSSMVETHEQWHGRMMLEFDRDGQSDLATNTWGFNFWKVKVTYDLTVNSVTTTNTLEVVYENGNYRYMDYNSFDLPATVNSYSVKVQKVEAWKNSTSPVMPGGTSFNIFNVLPIARDLHLCMELDTERGYELLNPEAPQMSFVSLENTLHWGYVEGAEWYDVEWVFLDKESREYAEVATATADFATAGQTAEIAALAFEKKEATRVRVWGNSYKLDMAYPEGQLFFRIRSVGLFSGPTYGGMTDQVLVSDWTYHEDATTSGTGSDYLTHAITTGFEEDLNWSYGIAFSEGGKSVSSVSYYDGTFRGRQSLTYNTSDNVTLIGEAKFDYEGRQTVSVLPAPVHGRDLVYHTAFNKSGGDIFDEDDFDKPNPDELDATGYTGDGGAGEYFGTDNSFPEDLFRAAIPNAQGYVYSQTVFRNDGSGRIEKAGGVGPEFTIDGDHVARTYYATPTVAELKRLFGENVPDELNGYRKIVTRDPNGQHSMAIYDKRGNLIATALVGGSPSSLKKLPELIDLETAESLPQITTSLLGTNSLTQDGLSLVAETTIFNEVEDNLYTFTYDIDDALQQLEEICFTCKYTLNIQVLGPDLAPLTLSTTGVSPTAIGTAYTEEIGMTVPEECDP
jgi:hypothetical protein